MDFWESMNIVHRRIQEIEPENASKIFCYLLLMKENGEREMIRLAFCPDSVMHSVINCVKYELAKNARHYHTHTPHHIPIKFGSLPGFYESSSEIDQFLNFDESWTNSEFSNAFYPHQRQYLPLRMSRRSPSLPEFPVKTCHYFNKGFCKHGNNCRYVHEKVIPERGSFAQMFNPNLSDEDQVVSPGSLEKLEGEIVELLKSRRGIPISIASLPMIYYEKYGRILQAEGYLTESQRHGKAGYSLTKLLARLNNTIRLIDRPHGQHSVILAEDVSKYLEYSGGGERNEQQRQIYLTFPAESSFTADEVSNYFSTFGHVEDVRIPTSNSEKRMFGFVTFSHTETVKEVLSQGNPHFICGARVLVKPYKEKSRCIRHDTTLHGMRYGSQFIDRDVEMNTLSMRVRESSSRQIRKSFRSEYEQSRSVSKSLPNNFSYLGFSSDDFNQTSNEQEEQQVERLNYLLGYLNTEDDELNIATNFRDEDSQVLNLPESPFSPLSGKEISTVT